MVRPGLGARANYHLYIVCLVGLVHELSYSLGCSFHTDHLKMPPETSDELRKRAKRIGSSKDGVFAASETRVGPPKLTHDFLMAAQDAVVAVAAEEPTLSGKDQYRLLARAVADSRLAHITLDKAEAEKVGKRLARQADQVRAKITHIRTETNAE